MQIGVISDTHNFLDPKVRDLFKGVDHILHAGDIGQPWILTQLEELAPVTAVIGNTDTPMQARETEVCELAGRKFMVSHIVDPDALTEPLRKRISLVQPDVVVFGHTHKPFQRQIGRTLFLNPGYAGKPRFAMPRTVAILHCGGNDLTPEFLPL